MIEYERRFNQLSRYVLYLVDTKGKKARCLERGLHREIARILASLDLPTYTKISRRAHAISTRLGMETPAQRQLDASWKRKWNSGNNRKGNQIAKKGKPAGPSHQHK